MKKQFLSLALTLASGFFFAAGGATLIQYNFDNPEHVGTVTYHEDISDNGHRVKFNRTVTAFSNYPFSTTHPELANLDKSGRTRYTAATQGTVENASSINLATTNVFTMEGWVFVEDFGKVGTTSSYLWTLSSDVGGTSSFALGYDKDGFIFGTFNSQSQAVGTLVLNTNVKLELNAWSHLAYVKAANSVFIYLDGALIGTLTEPGVTSRSLPTALKSATIASNIYGQFDDLRLSDAALTPEQFGLHAPFTTIPEPAAALLLIPTLAGFCLIKKRAASRQAA